MNDLGDIEYFYDRSDLCWIFMQDQFGVKALERWTGDYRGTRRIGYRGY